MKTEEDALNLIIKTLREEPPKTHEWAGYGVYLPHIIRRYVTYYEKLPDIHVPGRIIELSPLFYNAAWRLCVRGILRPGVEKFGEQATPGGNAGDGYTITPFGKVWLAESQYDDFVPTEPGRFARMITPFKTRFGAGFHERAQEAIKCYGAHAYLSCCVMCGAATESIILAIAIEKKDEETVLKDYTARGGRGRIENLIIGQANKTICREFKGYTVLLKYWRDESAHGRRSNIADDEAYTSLAILLRFAHYANDNWIELTK